jgi:hypothetical protein
MSFNAKIPAMVVVAAFCLAARNQADLNQANGAASSPVAKANGRKPAAQPVSDVPAAALPIKVTRLRVPNGGIQPQALVDAKGTLHLVYFKGDDATAGDLFYVHRDADQAHFSSPIRINRPPSHACAAGSVRGGQIALGRGGRVHVVWNGVGIDYARLNDFGTRFEGQRNLMQITNNADGGGTVAADDAGNVYALWHGHRKGEGGEDNRRPWVVRSTDDGKTFSVEAPAWAEPTGACACCSTRAFADHNGYVHFLYRSATAQVNRDIYLLASNDKCASFRGALVHKWKVPG